MGLKTYAFEFFLQQNQKNLKSPHFGFSVFLRKKTIQILD